MVLTTALTILIFLSTTAFAATDMVVGNHRRLLQDFGDYPEEKHHFQITDIFKRVDIIVYTSIGLLFLTIISCSVCRYLRSKKDAPAPAPAPAPPRPQQ